MDITQDHHCKSNEELRSYSCYLWKTSEMSSLVDTYVKQIDLVCTCQICCLHICKWLEVRTGKLRHLALLNTSFSTVSKWKMYLIT